MAKAQKAQEPQDLDLETLEEKLLEQRRDITSMYEHDVRAGKESASEGSEDLVDRATNSYNRELWFSLSTGERQTLLEVEEALKRMEEGTYGSCVSCGEEIGSRRLEAVPWARYCIKCQELAEQGLLEEDEA